MCMRTMRSKYIGSTQNLRSPLLFFTMEFCTYLVVGIIIRSCNWKIMASLNKYMSLSLFFFLGWKPGYTLLFTVKNVYILSKNYISGFSSSSFFYLPNFFNSKFCSRIFSLDMRHFLWLILLCFDLFFRRRRRFFCKIKIHIISMLLKIWRISKQIIVVQ